MLLDMKAAYLSERGEAASPWHILAVPKTVMISNLLQSFVANAVE
jgi:hypothetical protein